MRDAESMPENDVCVIDLCGGIGGNPGGKSLRGFARGLGDVATCRVDLVVGV